MLLAVPAVACTVGVLGRPDPAGSPNRSGRSSSKGVRRVCVVGSARRCVTRHHPAAARGPPPACGPQCSAPVTAAKPTASASAILIMLSERAYDFDALHPVAISNAGEDQSALLNSSGRGRWPRSTTRTRRWRSSSGARGWLRRRGLGRDSAGHAGARLHGLARSDLVLGGDGPAPVFRTE